MRSSPNVVPSLLVITSEVLDMACQSVLSDMNSIKRHLLIEFLVNVTDVFIVHVFSQSHHCHIIVTSRACRDVLYT